MSDTIFTASECLRETLDGIDDCAAVIATAREKCAHQLHGELEKTFSDSEELDRLLESIDDCEMAREWRYIKDWYPGQKIGKRAVHLGEALDIIDNVQGDLGWLRFTVADGLHT